MSYTTYWNIIKVIQSQASFPKFVGEIRSIFSAINHTPTYSYLWHNETRPNMSGTAAKLGTLPSFFHSKVLPEYLVRWTDKLCISFECLSSALRDIFIYLHKSRTSVAHSQAEIIIFYIEILGSENLLWFALQIQIIWAYHYLY